MGKVKMVNSVTESDCFRPLNTSHVKKPKQKCPNIGRSEVAREIGSS